MLLWNNTHTCCQLRDIYMCDHSNTQLVSNNIYMTVKIVLAASKYSNKIFMSGCKTSTTLWHRPQAGAVTVIFCLSLSTGCLLKTDQCSYIIIAECPKIKGQNNSQMCKVVWLIKTNNITSLKFTSLHDRENLTNALLSNAGYKLHFLVQTGSTTNYILKILVNLL